MKGQTVKSMIDFDQPSPGESTRFSAEDHDHGKSGLSALLDQDYNPLINYSFLPESLAAAILAVGTGTMNVTLMADSTGFGTNNVDGKNYFDYFCQSLADIYPDTAIAPYNRSFGGKSIANAASDTLCQAYPDYATKAPWLVGLTDKTWKQHILDTAPDLLLIGLGTNVTTTAEHYASLVTLQSWFTVAKTPSIVLITGLVPNPSDFPATEIYLANAECSRRFAADNGWGLVDFSRRECALWTTIGEDDAAERGAKYYDFADNMAATSGGSVAAEIFTCSGAASLITSARKARNFDLSFTAPFDATSEYYVRFREGAAGSLGYRITITQASVALTYDGGAIDSAAITALSGAKVIKVAVFNSAVTVYVDGVSVYSFAACVLSYVRDYIYLGATNCDTHQISALSITEFQRVKTNSYLTTEDLLGPHVDNGTGNGTRLPYGGNGVNHGTSKFLNEIQKPCLDILLAQIALTPTFVSTATSSLPTTTVGSGPVLNVNRTESPSGIQAFVGSQGRVNLLDSKNAFQVSAFNGSINVLQGPADAHTIDYLTPVNGISNVENNNTTILKAFGLRGKSAAIANGCTAHVVDSYGVYSRAPSLGGGSIDTHYGLYVEAFTGATTNWGLYYPGVSASWVGGAFHWGGTDAIPLGGLNADGSIRTHEIANAGSAVNFPIAPTVAGAAAFPAETTLTIANLIRTSFAETTIPDTTLIPFSYTTSGFVLRHITGANYKAQLKAYFDGIYQVTGSYAAAVHTHLLAAGATDVTASAAELNVLDDSGVTNADLIKLHAITETADHINAAYQPTAGFATTNAFAMATSSTALQQITTFGTTLLADTAVMTEASGSFTIPTAGNYLLSWTLNIVHDTTLATVVAATDHIRFSGIPTLDGDTSFVGKTLNTYIPVGGIGTIGTTIPITTTGANKILKLWAKKYVSDATAWSATATVTLTRVG